MLGSVNDSNVHNNLPYQSMIDPFLTQDVFVNPIPVNNQNSNINQQSNRLTFGDDHRPQQFNEDDLFNDMSQLKDKVMDMLQRYSTQVKQVDNSNKRELKQQFKNDAEQVAQQYSMILEKFEKSDISQVSLMKSTIESKKEQDLTMMFDLVDEFLVKFKNLSSNNHNTSQLIRSKLGQSVSPPNQKAILIEDHQQTLKQSGLSSQYVKQKAQSQFRSEVPTNQEVTPQLDMTVMPYIPKMDDSFYDSKTISLDSANKKLLSLKRKLQEELQKDNMPYTQKILTDMITNLEVIIDTQDTQLFKTVMYKIEQGIKELNQGTEGSMKLYKYLNKAILHSKKKQDMLQPRQSVQQQMRLTETVQQWSQDEKAIQYKNFTDMRQSEQLSLKRMFYDAALSKKNQLPANHRGRDIMVSDLYDEYITKGSGDIYTFISQKLS